MAANNFNLLTKDYEGMPAIAPAGGVVAGDMRKIASVVGVFPIIVAEGAEGAFIYKTEKIQVAKSTGVTFTVGAKVYFDAAAKAVTSVDAGNTLCGRAREISATGAVLLKMKLNGDVEA